MTVLRATQLGHGPDLVLLHGVGLGPETFSALARALAGQHRVLLIDRHGADDSEVLRLEDQTDAVASTMRHHGFVGALVVGVSGGATLGLLLGIRQPEVVTGMVLHEPLLGAHEPQLQQRLAAAAEQAARGDGEALGVVRSLVGEETWGGLDDHALAQVEAEASRARVEIALFAAFSPGAQELAGLRRLPILTTVGARSGPERHAAAAVLAELAGATVAVVGSAGNAVQLDAPAAFAAAVMGWHAVPARWRG